MQVSKTGSICWAAFLEMGARHENSPTIPLFLFMILQLLAEAN